MLTRVSYLVGAGLGCVVGLGACGGASNTGFGGGGNHVDPVQDTGPWETSETTDTTDTTDTTGDTTDTSTTGETGTTDSATDTATGPVIEGTGYDRGDVAYDLVAPDQNEVEWSLHSHYGGVVLLVIGDGYDPLFTDISKYLGEMETKYGIETAALLLSDPHEAAADVEDAVLWADTYHVPTVLFDPSAGRDLQMEWAPIVRPLLLLIDDEMVIAWKNTGSTSQTQIEEKIEDLVY